MVSCLAECDLKIDVRSAFCGGPAVYAVISVDRNGSDICLKCSLERSRPNEVGCNLAAWNLGMPSAHIHGRTAASQHTLYTPDRKT